jgi:hypothetical protein
MATDAPESRLDRVEAALLRLVEAQVRTEEQLAGAQRRTEERVGRLDEALTELAAAQRRTEERLERLAADLVAAVAQTEDQFVRLTRETGRLAADLVAAVAQTEDQFVRLTRETGRLKGWNLEAQYRDKAHAYFQRILRRIRSVSREDIETLADEAEEKGALSSDDHVDLMQADVVIRGRLRDGRTEVYLVAEVSSVVDPEDVARSHSRAKLLARLVSPPVIAAVAGEWVTKSADEEAVRLGVWRVLNGRTFPPNAPAVKL